MKVKFIPQNIEVEGNSDKSLLQIATENHIEIRSICKGVPSCAECRVRIVEGDRNVVPPAKAELDLIGSSYFIDSRRLSCQVRCFGDITVDLTEQVERAENQTKKIRGFRTNKQMESKAVNDTMLLSEKIETSSQPEAREPQEPRSQQHQQQAKNPQHQQQKKQQHQHQNQKQGQQKQQGQGRGQGRDQGQQQKGSQPKQQQHQNQKQGQSQQGQNPKQNQKKNEPPKV